MTFDGAMGPNATNIANLAASTDMLVFTYYPLGVDLHPRVPKSPEIDFPRMRSLAGGRPVVLQEVGYPSSAFLTSSEPMQAAFVTSAFQAWGTSASQIPFINFFLLHDFTDSECDQSIAYYGFPSDQNLHAFVCSIGLRNADGSPKQAWQAFVDAAASLTASN